MLTYFVHVTVCLFPLAPVERSCFALTLDEGFAVYKSSNKDESQKQKVNGPGGEGNEPAGVVLGIERV